MTGVADRLADIHTRIASACDRSGRPRESVELIAVSKNFPAEAVREANHAGQVHFGESRLQEAEDKARVLPDSIHWHFIGRVQRNKVRRIMSLCETIHGIDSARLAVYADRIAGELRIRPKVFFQINIGDEESKGGFSTKEISSEMESLMSLPHLSIQGLMCIPPIEDDPQAVRRWFAALRELRDQLVEQHSVSLPYLSMGMSGDFEEAILEGATHVRVGSAIFGTRSYRVDEELGQGHD